jgi:hypothetical protein
MVYTVCRPSWGSARRRLEGSCVARSQGSTRSAGVVIGHSIGHSPHFLARFHSLRLALSKRQLAHLQAMLRWRDPDSNRGHHDFQSVTLPTSIGVICRDFPEGHSLWLPVVSRGFGWVVAPASRSGPKRVSHNTATTHTELNTAEALSRIARKRTSLGPPQRGAWTSSKPGARRAASRALALCI